MKEFFYYYADLTTLLLALGITSVRTFRTWKKTGKRTRLGMLALLFFGPVLIVTCMSSHLIEVTYHGFETGFTGKFSLCFHFFSLLLLGTILGNAGIQFVRGVRAFVFSETPRKAMVVQPAAVVVLIIFPLMWITPLSFIILMVTAISIGASFLVHKQRKTVSHHAMDRLPEAIAV